MNDRTLYAIKLKTDGATYREIAGMFGISRQMVQQMMRPPVEVALAVRIVRAEYKCEQCGQVSIHGHFHHKTADFAHFNNADNIAYLCASCHRRQHGGERRKTDPIAFENKIYQFWKTRPITQSDTARIFHLTIAEVRSMVGKARRRLARSERELKEKVKKK
jgi:hypothetical protein